MSKDSINTRIELHAALATLRDLQQCIAVYCSGKEVALAANLIKRAGTVLNPEKPEAVLIAMQRMIFDVQHMREQRKRQDAEQQASSENADAERKRAKDTMHARQKAEHRAKLDRQQRSVAEREAMRDG